MKLKGDNGVQYTQGLFYEFNNPDAPYTLRTEDYTARSGKTYRSIYQIFMDAVDEYEAAELILGSQEHWRKLCKQDWFLNGKVIGAGDTARRMDGLLQWREDKKAKDASLAKKLLIQEAENGSVSAQKILYDSARKDAKPVKKEKAPTTKGSPVSDLSARLKGLQNEC